ncbi:MAG TPA: 50S ribosomal protein L9 [Anaerolineales bacterium]|jgi:large subunit ribosomal protein L9
MKVLLLEDVYKLGRAGEVKRVADGYGRNYLLPQGLAVLATPGALKQSEHIKQSAAARREVLNQEMGDVAERLSGVVLTFPARASETGKLYGSVTTQMIADALSDKAGVEIERRQIDSQPLRSLGEHSVAVRLTVDLVPEVAVIVHREGEAPVMPGEAESEEAEEVEEAEAVAMAEEIEAQTETEEAEEAEESEPESVEE